MAAKKLPYGKPVKFLADFQGFPDGRIVQFEISRKKKQDGKDQGEDKNFAQVNGATKGGKALAWWNPDFGNHKVELKESATGGKIEETYYFVAKIDALEKKSDEFEFAFPLTVNLKDEKAPLHDVEYTITLSDGSKKTAKISGGLAKFSEVPLGKVKIEVEGYTPSALHGLINRGITVASGTLTREVSFNVKLFINEAATPPDSMFTVEKLNISTSKYERVKGDEDLLDIQTTNLRVAIEDNAGNGDPVHGESSLSRDRFYVHNHLVGVLNALVPLRSEVKKFEGQSKTATPLENDEVEAVFEVVDLAEDTGNVKGPRSGMPKTGKKFVDDFIKVVKTGTDAGNDNCIRDYGARPFRGRCRRAGDEVAASDVLYVRRGGALRPLTSEASDRSRASVDIRASQNGRPEGIANVFFNPPTILGDNYRLKITIRNKDGKEMSLKDTRNNLYLLYFQTPPITVWKRVKIQMVVCQGGVNFNAIKWDEVKNAYRDAFIDIEEPPAARRFNIALNDWMNYLERFVYGPQNTLHANWRRNNWRTYRQPANNAAHNADLNQYSFPQQHATIAGSGNLTPSDDAAPTSWDLLGLLAARVVRDRLGAAEWGRFRSPFRGRRIGLCVFLCRPSSATSGVGGRHEGGRLFYMVLTDDLTGTFIHEMGHALFLRHGATAFARATTNTAAVPVTANSSLVYRSEEEGSEGPFFDEHYSEGMIPCVMGYDNSYYDENGNVLASNPVNWHFCGVCLLQLRFYNTIRMLRADNDSFRRLQYSKKPQIASRGGAPVVGPGGVPIGNLSFSNAITVRRGRRRNLFILYPKEGVNNNFGLDLYKDVCFLTRSRIVGTRRRARWISSNPTVADVRVIRIGTRWLSIVRGLRAGNTTITFEVRYGPNAGDVVTSDPINVQVTAP